MAERRSIPALLFLALCALCGMGFAEAEGYTPPGSNASGFSRGRFISNRYACILGSSVNLRQNPSRASEVVTKLAAGEPVRIEGQVEDSLEGINGLLDHWYKVRLAEKESTVGFVWGGLLARVALASDFDRCGRPELLLVGIQSRDTARGVKLVEARALRGIKQLSSVIFDPPVMNPGSEVRVSIEGEILPDGGFMPPAALLRIGFEKHGEASALGQSYLCFSRGVLRHVLSFAAPTTNEAPPLPFLVFPREPGGSSNTLLLHRIELMPQSNATVWRTNTTRYAWDGDAFTLKK